MQEDNHENICYSEDVLVNPPRDKYLPAQYEGYDDYVNEIAPRETTEPPSKVKIKVDIVYFSLVRKSILELNDGTLDTVQDFLIRLGIKPHMHPLKLGIFSLFMSSSDLSKL